MRLTCAIIHFSFHKSCSSRILPCFGSRLRTSTASFAITYILTVCTLTLSAIIVEIVQIINMIIRHNFHISGLLTIFTIIFIAGLLPPAFMFPFTFKLGAEKGRFAYYIGFILLFALLGSLQSVIKNLPLGLAHFPFRSYYILILLFIGLLLYMISWILSIKFYQNREF